MRQIQHLLSIGALVAMTLTCQAYAKPSSAKKPKVTHTANQVIHHPLTNFPISAAIEVPKDKNIIYLSGMVPTASQSRDTKATYGDTQAQAENVLAQIQSQLAKLGLEMKDIVKMQVFLKAPTGQAHMDFQGFQKAYLKYFDADSGRLPVRSTFEVAGLANPEWLVEIEVMAVRP